MAFWDIGINISVNTGNAITNLNAIVSAVNQLGSLRLSPLGNLIGPLAAQATQAKTSIDGLTGSVERFKATSATPLGLVPQLQQANTAVGVFSAGLTQLNAAATTTSNTFRAGLAGSVAAVGGPLNSLNTQLANTSTQFAATTTSGNRFLELFRGNRGLVFGLSALFGTITGIVFELQLMTDAQSQVAESQAIVNQLIAAGQQDTAQYQQAVQALGKDMRFLEFSTRNLALAFTNLVPDIILIITGITNLALKARELGGAQGFAGAASAAQTFSRELRVVKTTAVEAEVAMAALGATSLRSMGGGAAAGAVGGAGPLGRLFGGLGGAASGGLAAGGIAGGLGRSGIMALLGRAAGIAGGAGVVAGPVLTIPILYEFIYKPAAAGVDKQILESNKMVAEAGQTIADDFAKKVETGTATAADRLSFLASTTSTVADSIVTSSERAALAYQNMLDAAAGAGVQTQGTGKPAPSVPLTAPSGAEMSPFGTKGAQERAEGVERLYGGRTALGKPLPTTQEIIAAGGFNAAEAGLRGKRLDERPLAVAPEQAQKEITSLGLLQNQSKALTTELANMQTQGGVVSTAIGDIGLKGEVTTERLANLLDVTGSIASETDKLATADGAAALAGRTRIAMLTDELVNIIENKDATIELGKQQDDYNQRLDKLPKIYQEVGSRRKENTTTLAMENALIAESAAAFVGWNVAAGQTRGVQEQIADQGRKLTDGLITQRDAISANNLIWENFNTIIPDSSTKLSDFVFQTQRQIIASIDVTQALTNESKATFLRNQGMIEGTLAGQQFLESTIQGVAANEAYGGSLTLIAEKLNILPQGFALTNQELEALIANFLETGSAAIALSDIVDNRLASSFETFANVLSAKNDKEFKEAFKGLEFGDAPEKFVSGLKEVTRAAAQFAEKGRELKTSADGIIAFGDALSKPELRKGVDFLAEGIDQLDKNLPQGNQLDPIVSFLDNLTAADRVQGVTDIKDTLDLLWAKVDDGSLSSLDAAAAMSQFTTDMEESGRVTDDFRTKMEDLGAQFDDATGKLKEFIIQGKELPEVFQKAGVASVALSASGAGIRIKPKEPLTEKELAKQQEAIFGTGGGKFDLSMLGKKGSAPEEKFDGSVKMFAVAVSQFAGAIKPTTSTQTPTGATQTGGQATTLNTMAQTAAKVVPQIQALFTTLAKNVVAVVGAMDVQVVKLFGDMTKKTVTEVGAMVTGVTGMIFPMIKNVVATISAMRTGVITIVAQMSKGVQTEVTAMYGFVTDVITTLGEEVSTTVETMSSTVIDHAATMNSGVQTEVTAMYDFTTEVFTKMSEEIPKTTQTMADDTIAIMKTFASDFDTEMQKVQTAAEDATAAVAALDTAVGNLDGASAKVTITTTFVTNGSPPAGASGLIDYGGVTSAAANKTISNAALGKVITSFQEGGLETTHGPKMVIYGDNPGGVETHAFIPHDNPFPTLRKLAKLFRGRGSANDVVNSGMLGDSGELVVNLESHIHQHLDSREIGVQVTRQTFRKLRTRMG